MIFGKNTIDEYSLKYFDKYSISRDFKVYKALNKSYDKVLLVGMLPVPLALMLETKITILDNSAVLEYWKPQLEDKFGFNVVLKDPLFDDIQTEIDSHDLIVYHDSEYLVPSYLMKQKHKNKDVLIMNTYTNDKHGKNIYISTQDLIDEYPMEEVYTTGFAQYADIVHYDHSRTRVYTNFVHGRIND